MNTSVLFFILFIYSKALIVHSKTDVVYSHIVAPFSYNFENIECTSQVVEVELSNDCSTVITNVTQKIGIMFRAYLTSTCTIANQVSALYESKASGIVLINTNHDNSETSFPSLNHGLNDQLNITIPVIGISYKSGTEILSLLHSNSSLRVTISKTGEYSPIMKNQYLIILLVLLFLMWIGLGMMDVLNKVSIVVKKQHRKYYVNQIKCIQFHLENNAEVEELPTCSICLCNFKENDSIKKLHCGHMFHTECIDPWLLNEKAVCPVCRRGIYENNACNQTEDSVNRDIDIIICRVEKHLICSLSNLFTFVFCIFIVGFPLTLALLSR